MKPFNFSMTVAKAEHDDRGYFLRGVSSTTDLDRQQDVMAPSALADMQKYVNQIPLTDSHTNEIGNEIGTLVEANVEDGKFVTVFKLDEDDALAMRLYNKIAKGSHCGFSVGGRILSTTPGLEKGVKRVIEHVELDHIALTKKPANPNTFASAFAKALDEITAEELTMNESTEIVAKDATTLLGEAVALLKTEADANLAKVGAKFSADTLATLSNIHGMLGELLGLNTTAVGDNNNVNAVDPVAGGGQATTAGNEIISEPNSTAAKSITADDVKDLIKTAIVENIVPLLKSERSSLVANQSDVIKKSAADEFRETKSISELRAAFARRITVPE